MRVGELMSVDCNEKYLFVVSELGICYTGTGQKIEISKGMESG